MFLVSLSGREIAVWRLGGGWGSTVPSVKVASWNVTFKVAFPVSGSAFAVAGWKVGSTSRWRLGGPEWRLSGSDWWPGGCLWWWGSAKE